MEARLAQLVRALDFYIIILMPLSSKGCEFDPRIGRCFFLPLREILFFEYIYHLSLLLLGLIVLANLKRLPDNRAADHEFIVLDNSSFGTVSQVSYRYLLHFM